MEGRTPASRIVVVGSSFAGLTAAFELRQSLGERAEIVVVDRRDSFTFIPSLIWVPFGGRESTEITFPLAATYEDRGIRFLNDVAESVDTDWRQVVLSHHGHLSYDRLLVATGPHLDFERIPGLGPESGYTESICTLDHALRARSSWERLMADPGPVVVGTAQGAAYFHPSYEYVLNGVQRMRAAGITTPVSFVTSEPFLGHFGLGRVGRARHAIETTFARLDIEALPDQAITEVREGEVELESGRVLPFAHAMIIPPVRGVDMVRASLGLGNDAGWIPVDDQFRHVRFPEVFAAGADVALGPPQSTPGGAPAAKTGYMSQNMARVAARNIAADLGVGTHRGVPEDELGTVTVVDGGGAGMIVRTDSALGEAKHTHLIEGPQAHWAKVAFEKFFLATRKRGGVRG